MRRKITVFLATLALALSIVPAAPALAATNIFEQTCQAPGSSNSTACQQSGADPLTGANGLITNVTKIISYLTGIAAIIMLLVAGFMFITSDGDASKVASARQTAIYALVGVIITVVAQGIVVFVLTKI